MVLYFVQIDDDQWVGVMGIDLKSIHTYDRIEFVMELKDNYLRFDIENGMQFGQ